MSTVPGDPASLSACAVTSRQVATALEEDAAGIRGALEALGEQWAGRTSARTRHRAAGLVSTSEATAAQLRHVGGVLQDHATELADLVARARAVDEQAAAAGLEVRGGRVTPAFGVTGTADSDREGSRAATAERLQRDLDLVLAQHRRRRDWVLEVLRDSTASLAALSHRVRQG